MANVLKAIQIADCRDLEDFPVGGWAWLHRRTGIIFKLPNGNLGSIHADRWSLTGDGETITASPSIWHRQGQGSEAGEWHGFLQAGEWRW